ncbi:MAG TPA: GNAT family N-acetyltransferase [Solirubrobacteraceae bacterium]|nr:GNAT family N-acetyltransferase [Solirubrobacteraceae bacterium]
MLRELDGGYELDDDPRRIDVDAVHRFLAEQSYWARGRAHSLVLASIEGSQRVAGLYRAGELVGFARAVTDTAIFAMLADVFVLEPHRGRGLGLELVRFIVEDGPFASLGWWLTTGSGGGASAQGLYEKLGFSVIAGTTVMVRARRGAV